LSLGLYNHHGELDRVRFTSTIADADRADLTTRLEALRQPPGFTGKARRAVQVGGAPNEAVIGNQ